MLPEEARYRNAPFLHSPYIASNKYLNSPMYFFQSDWQHISSLKGGTMKELFDHLKLAQIAFGCHFTKNFTCVTGNVVRLKKRIVTACYRQNKVNIFIFISVFMIIWMVTVCEWLWHCQYWNLDFQNFSAMVYPPLHIEVQTLVIKFIALPRRLISYTANEMALRKDGEPEPC